MAIVQLHHGTSVISKLITWQTRSSVSHASVWFPEDDAVLESKEFYGVRQITGASLAPDVATGRVQRFTVPGLTVTQAGQVRQFMTQELGAGYDYRAVLKFITRRRAATNTRWFCSELVFAAFLSADVRLLSHVDAWAVSPGDLLKSPLLVPLDPSASALSSLSPVEE